MDPRKTRMQAAVADPPVYADDLGDEASVPELAEAVAHKGAADVTALSLLEEIRSMKFFSLYSIDLLANCAYIGGPPDECEFDACEVLPVEPVPKKLMERDMEERGFELDAWARFDLASEDYYNLEEYPEGYTGYDGSSVWKFLYENLTFGQEAIAEENDPNGWHSVFDKAVSGLHASIACHVVDDYSDDDEECAAEFTRRIACHPERLSNLRFAFALVLAGVRESKQAMKKTKFDDDPDVDQSTRELVQGLFDDHSFMDGDNIKRVAPLLRAAASQASECSLETSGDDEWIEEKGIWEVRQRSRAVLRLFDCVQCGACRIHGKVAWFGVATALKLIYSDASTRPLCRVEVAALLTTLAKLATAVRFAEEMEDLCCAQSEGE